MEKFYGKSLSVTKVVQFGSTSCAPAPVAAALFGRLCLA
jgi:hypothetical protein